MVGFFKEGHRTFDQLGFSVRAQEMLLAPPYSQMTLILMPGRHWERTRSGMQMRLQTPNRPRGAASNLLNSA